MATILTAALKSNKKPTKSNNLFVYNQLSEVSETATIYRSSDYSVKISFLSMRILFNFANLCRKSS